MGAEVNPGQKLLLLPLSHFVQLGGTPKKPGGQPEQAVLVARLPEAGKSGGGHTRGTHWEMFVRMGVEAVVAEMGEAGASKPGGQVTATATHWVDA